MLVYLYMATKIRWDLRGTLSKSLDGRNDLISLSGTDNNLNL
jgi:hypothetical protein